MNAKITCVSSGETVAAKIIQPVGLVLPSVNDGWRFDFEKHVRKKYCRAFVLVCEDTPDVIEGCLIFEMRNGVEPYMAFIEVAPHNRGKDRVYANVAGCLTAAACRLSEKHGTEHYRGWLTFDVKEHRKEDEIKIMALYCQKYGAVRWGQATMLISPENGEELISKFLMSEQ
ncbi:hypothetical protein SAMN04487996_1174 [Dyadobacter soli]|uniref:N-acetyltransferase domain-containing protein n=1 Tax=Dyadobacter soli TaxID=659014 RepID=A0A1G7SXP5_9BACT|nr:hypothetical protein [Dyadobacter soli]SDG27199.1 hypothetical protein SAMN04487996_1174 [Dyadobacter soli]